MKQITGVYTAPAQHWVGDGFPVRSMFSYQTHGQQLSPFLLLDYAGPYTFPAGSEKRGVGEHPHRGFETVTIVYAGEVEHRDSTGRGGVIGQRRAVDDGGRRDPARRVPLGGLHPQRRRAEDDPAVGQPARERQNGGPGYQSITAGTIPTVALANGAGQVRVIAGQYDDVSGPAHTFSPLNVGSAAESGARPHAAPTGGLEYRAGGAGREVIINGSESAREGQLAVLSAGDAVHLEATAPAKVLLMAGEPLQEPIVGYGPFVMNNKTQIAEAVRDFNSGRFGQI